MLLFLLEKRSPVKMYFGLFVEQGSLYQFVSLAAHDPDRRCGSNYRPASLTSAVCKDLHRQACKVFTKPFIIPCIAAWFRSQTARSLKPSCTG